MRNSNSSSWFLFCLLFLVGLTLINGQTTNASVQASSMAGEAVTCAPAAVEEAGDTPLGITLRIIGAVVLTLLAGLFSGLTLGLMSLESLELELLIKAGDERQAKYAKRIQPVRKHGNRLLCTLLLTNVAVYTAMPILISNLTDGVIGFIVSTILSVMVGEIIPQAICARHGLAIGAHTVWIVKILMVLLFPIAWPIAKMLDCLLGKEIAEAYSRKELSELILYHAEGQMEEGTGGDLNIDETTIIRNALQFSLTTVDAVMTPLAKTFVLPVTGILDEHTMVRISKAGYSRIPIVEGHRGHNVGLLIVKTLFLLSPMAKVPIKRVLDVTKHKCVLVEHNTTLDVMLNAFQWGKSHLAIVRKKRSDATAEEIAQHEREVAQTESHRSGKALTMLRNQNQANTKVAQDAAMAVINHNAEHDKTFGDREDNGTRKKEAAAKAAQAESKADADASDSGTSSDDDDDDDNVVDGDEAASDTGKRRKKVRKRVRIKSPPRKAVSKSERVVRSESMADDASVSSSSSSSSSVDTEDEEILQNKKEKLMKAMGRKHDLIKGEPAVELQQRLASVDYISIGVVTLEDVVEELIGEEIMDETDFDEGSLAAAAAGRESVDQMMAMAYASIKWKALANATPIAAGGAPADAVPPSEPRLRRARSLESSTLKDIRFKSAPVSTKKLLRAYDSETADDLKARRDAARAKKAAAKKEEEEKEKKAEKKASSSSSTTTGKKSKSSSTSKSSKKSK